MREEALFKAGEKDEREFEAFGGVQSHQRDAGIGIEFISVRGESCVVEEIGESFATLLGVVRGVGQLFQILDAAECFGRALGLESFDVAGAIDDEADELGERGGVAGRTETGVSFRIWFAIDGAIVPWSQNRDQGHPNVCGLRRQSIAEIETDV